jgi:hypothetical protein
MAIQFVTDQFKDANITTAKIANDGVTADKVDLNAGDYAFTANATLSWAKAPTATDDVANKAYVDAVASGLDLKESVVCATTGNITTASDLNVGDAIDGITLADGDRVLVKDQTTGSQNGIYIAGASPARSTDFAAGDDEAGAFMFVEEGSVNGDAGWVCTNDKGAAVVGTNALIFTQFSGAGQITAGDGLTKTGNTLAVQVDNSSIEIAADTLRVKSSGITNAMLAGSIANSNLANSSMAIGGVTLTLGATDATPAFVLTDATGYLTSNLTGTITNAQLAGSIADSKLNAITTEGKVALSALEIDGGTDIGAALADADLMIVDDGAGGTNRKATMSRVPTYVFSKIAAGDVLINSSGVATIQSGAVDDAMLAGSISNGKLTNSTLTVSDGSNSTALSLGGTMTFTGTDFLEASGTISLATNAVTFAKLKVLPNVTGAAGDGSTKAFNLTNQVDATWHNRVLVFRNGALQQKVSSLVGNATTSAYTVTNAGSDTTVTFGAAPLANEVIAMSYLYEG